MIWGVRLYETAISTLKVELTSLKLVARPLKSEKPLLPTRQKKPKPTSRLKAKNKPKKDQIHPPLAIIGGCFVLQC